MDQQVTSEQVESVGNRAMEMMRDEKHTKALRRKLGSFALAASRLQIELMAHERRIEVRENLKPAPK